MECNWIQKRRHYQFSYAHWAINTAIFTHSLLESNDVNASTAEDVARAAIYEMSVIRGHIAGNVQGSCVKKDAGS